MKYSFSKAILNGISETYTYAHARNAYQYEGTTTNYDPYAFFEKLLEIEPFQTFMELDGFAYKKAKNTLDRYKIPYTREQERKAKVYFDVVNEMKRQRSDYVSMFMDNVEGTGVVLWKDPYCFTTQKTLDNYRFIKSLPTKQYTQNVLYDHLLDERIKRSKEQHKAVELCLNYKISCLIGGAGTGKSFVTASIVDQLIANGRKVSILAPTHKAKEALQSKLSPKSGTVRTIHSFVHRPDYCDVIVVDEASFISTPLFNMLKRAYHGQQLIFVGDKNQLPPVEYGRPFELIQKRFPVAELKENKRSESADIIALGREILGYPQNANMPLENIVKVKTVKEAFEHGAQVVLTQKNVDVNQINEQQKLGTNDAISPNFSIGDVIVAETTQMGRFYKGQLFKIISQDTIKDKNSGRTVKLSSYRDLDYNFKLAYGLTINKSQGSEWDVVGYLPNLGDTQNLAYVAVTRAKKKLIMIENDEHRWNDSYSPEREWKHINEINSI